MDKVKSSIWLAVGPNQEITEHASLDQAIKKSPDFILLEQEGIWVNGGYSNYAYGAEFYNLEGAKMDGIAINNWFLSGLKTFDGSMSNGFQKDRIWSKIIDPWGTSEERKFGTRRGGIVSALIFFTAASQFSSWQEFKLADPVEKEKLEVALLKEEIGQLKVENSELITKFEAILKLLKSD